LIAKSLAADEEKFKIFKEQTNQLFLQLEEEQTFREVIYNSLIIFRKKMNSLPRKLSLLKMKSSSKSLNAKMYTISTHFNMIIDP
jgi:hypothetical protein